MNKSYYVEVKTYSDSNRKGRELGKYIQEKCDKCVFSQDALDSMIDDLNREVEELEKRYPKITSIEAKGYDVLNGKIIFAKPIDKANDSAVFVMTATEIRNIFLNNEHHG